MLKEGFAMYFADVGMNMVYPEWNIVSKFIFQFFFHSSGGGRVVRWCWVNLQCRAPSYLD